LGFVELIIYPLLRENSKKAIARKWKNAGRYYTSPVYRQYFYTPRRQLVYRLMVELGWTERAVREQFEKERNFILKNIRYFKVFR
jgi:hypothetical protein